MRPILVALGLSLISFATSAHHSRAVYLNDLRELEGELVGVIWRNPHPSFTVKTTDGAGREEIWQIEAFASLYPLKRIGVTRDYFRIGERIKIVGRSSIKGEQNLLATNILLADNTEVKLTSGGELYWTSSENAVGVEGWITDDEDVVDTVAEDLEIFRVWSPSGRGENTASSPFTQSAIAARSTWDPLDNFIMRCEQPGMPFAMKAPHPYEFIDNGSEILLKGEAWDLVRTIHMDEEANAEDQPASHLGYSVGHWEGNTLVVRTTRINWPYFDRLGTPQSEDVVLVGRFTLSEDQGRLEYDLTVTDSSTFTEPATYHRVWVALGETLPTYDCQVF